jgi:bifunctional non-homologous end joining protein LigD
MVWGPFPVLYQLNFSEYWHMTIPTPLPLRQQTQPFDGQDWIYEIKHDGFRALAVIEREKCRFLSRTLHDLYGLGDLRAALAEELQVDDAVLDGELAVMDEAGRTLFAPMMRKRLDARYFAFDLIWLNGKDLRREPLLTRKNRLKQLVPRYSSHILYVDHVRNVGRRLFQIACQLDLEGIVAKRIDSPYAKTSRSPWIKINNPSYRERKGRREF